MGLIGPNGAGKTTSIKSILRLVHPDSGQINLFGKNILEGDPDIKNNIGIVMDLPFFPDDWKVKDVESGVAPFYSNWDRDQFESYLKRFSLNRKKKVKELSRGMKVKLMLAVALSHKAKFLALDEPTSGLDPVARDELMEILGSYISDEQNSVLFSTHITSDLEKIADYITFIRQGRIEFTGEKDALMEKYVLAKGDASTLSAQQKRLIIGYHEYSAGFNGMIQSEHISKLPQSVSFDKITMDEIIVYMNKEGASNE